MQGISLLEHGCKRPILGTVLLATTMLAGLPTAHAQQTGDSGALETVVVTAEKREENLQRVPVSIQALGNEKLTELHATDFTSFAKYLPSVEYTTGGQGGSGGPGFANVSMRGVNSGNDGNHSGSLPTVGVYLDEQPISTIGGTLDVPTYDVSRVEALSGPQGTLYGASSEAGTIRIITNKPDPTQFAAGYDAQVNSVDHGGVGYSLQGFVNQPLTDHIALRVVGWDEHDAGYIDNVLGTRTFPTSGATINNSAFVKNNYNTVDKIGGRAALQIDLNENWTITPSIMAQHEKSDGFFAYDPSVGDLEVSHYKPEYTKDNWYQAALTVQGKIGNLDLTYSGGYMDRKVTSSSDYNDYSFWYDTLYGYGAYIYNNAGTPIDPSQYILGKDHFTKFSNEIRLSSSKDDRFRWVVGAFQERQTHFIFQDYLINGIADSITVPGFPNTLWLTDQERVDTDYAAFGEASFDILPNLTLTGGLRLFEAKDSLKGFFGFSAGYSSHTGVSQCFDAASFRGGPCINLDKNVDKSGETHKINLTWQVNDDDMLYATYSTGFRPGGVNRRGSIPPYEPDTLTNYELGWKTSWLNDTLRLNGAVFYEDWKDFQFSFLGLNSFTEIHNAGSAHIKGVEADFNWRATDHLNFYGSGAYTYSTLATDFCGPVVDGVVVTVCPNLDKTVGPIDPDPPQAPKGTQLPVTPLWKLNVTGRYDFNLMGLDSYFQSSLVYQTGSWDDLRTNAPNPVTGTTGSIRSFIGRAPGFATVDFGFGVTHDNWTADLSLQNAFDERGQVYRFAECTTQVCGNEPYALPTRPRMIALSFGQRF